MSPLIRGLPMYLTLSQEGDRVYRVTGEDVAGGRIRGDQSLAAGILGITSRARG